jgi:hypothetical protein
VAEVKFDNGHWRFPEQLDFQAGIGFVYLIRHTATGVMYIGRKNFRLGGSKKTGGRQSNWRSYISSSTDLQKLVQKHGVGAFQFFVLEQYYTLGGLGWGETWSQAFAETPTNKKFLNGRIERVTWSSRELITARHKARLISIIAL